MAAETPSDPFLGTLYSPTGLSLLTAQIVEVSDEPLKRVIRELGGWPVADPTWDPENTLSLEKLIATLKRNFTLGVIVEEWVGPDDRNSLGHVIQVSSDKRKPELTTSTSFTFKTLTTIICKSQVGTVEQNLPHWH